MLTGELARARFSTQRGELRLDFLEGNDAHWQKTAADLIALLQQHLGATQAQWQLALERYEESRTDYMVIRGLAKVLSDSVEFTTNVTPVAPTEWRARLFPYGPVFSDANLLQPYTRERLLKEAAVEYNISSQQAEEMLYADRPAAAVLRAVQTHWTANSLIERYNLELARAALYWSDQMQVEIYDSFKDFWRYLKLFKLMFWATVIADGYQVVLDGPLSPFVQSTTRYGRQFAAFLPALFLCSRWQMGASVHLYNRKLFYRLSHLTPLASHFKRSGEFDSRLEADFAGEFQAKFGDARGQWRLSREDEVLLLGDTVMIPDFACTHKKDGRRALIEIVGYWHPDYLERKVEKVRAANCNNLLLLVYEGVNLGKEKLQDTPSEVIYFANKPVLKEVMAAVERIAC